MADELAELISFVRQATGDEQGPVLARVRLGEGRVDVLDADGDSVVHPLPLTSHGALEVIRALEVLARAQMLRELESGSSHEVEQLRYHGALHYDGRVRWQKEPWHVSYVSSPYVQALSALRGRWVGFKAILRNVLTAEGGTAVRLELWLDTRADGVSWVKVDEMTDDGR